MPMTITMPDDIADAAAEIARRQGTSPEQLLVETIRRHLLDVPPELQAELDAWELASEEDIARFERACC